MIDRPKIVALDDDEATVMPLIPAGYELVVVSPKDVPKHHNDFADAQLILVDFELYGTAKPLSMTAQDGAGFVAPLRSWARRERKMLPPTVILTNFPSAFATQMPAVGPAIELGDFVGHEARLAPALDVEWLLFKDHDLASEHIGALAKGYASICREVGTDGTSLKEMPNVLKLPAEVWRARAIEDIRRARPPISQGAKGSKISTDGPTEIVRWLCHRALAFPGLFISDLHAEWALGLAEGSMKKIAETAHRTQWLRTIASAEYRGPLADLVSRRWWRAGIDEATARLADSIIETNSIKSALKKLAPQSSLRPQSTERPNVVVWDADLVEREVLSVKDAVQVQPPGWPIEAMSPWMQRAEVKRDPRLKAMVDPIDES